MKNLPNLILILFVSILSSNCLAQNEIQTEFYLIDKNGKKITQTFSSINTFGNGGNAIVSINGKKAKDYEKKINGAKYGIINQNGTFILAAKYDYLACLNYTQDTIFQFMEGDKTGIININGKVIIPAIYSGFDNVGNSGTIIQSTNEDGYQQIWDITGKKLSEQYQNIELGENETGYLFRSNGYTGIMDNSFAVVVPANYTSLTILSNGNLIAKDIFLKTQILSETPKIPLTPKFDDIEPIYNFNDYNNNYGFLVTKKGKKGFIGNDYKIILPVEFSDIQVLEAGCANFIFICEKKFGEFYIYNKNGVKACPKMFASITSNTIFDKYLIVEAPIKTKSKSKNKNNDADYVYTPPKYSLIDFTGKKILPDDIADFTMIDDNLILLKSKGKWIAYSNNLTPVLKTPIGSTEKFTYIESIGENLYLVQIGGDDNDYGKPNGGIFGIYDGTGKQVVPLIYEDITTIGYGKEMMMMTQKNGKLGIIDFYGKQLVENIYEKMTCNEQFCIVESLIERISAIKKGVISTRTGKIITPIKYTTITEDNDNFFVEDNSKFGIINKLGEVLIKPKYNFIQSTNLYDNDYDFYLVNKSGKVSKDYLGDNDIQGGEWGVISAKGDTLLPIEYNKLEFMNDSTILVIDADKKSYLMAFPSLKKITDPTADYITGLNKSYLIGKDLSFDEYGYPVGGIFGLSDQNGKTIADYKYADITSISDYYICNYTEYDGFDLIDNEGNLLLQKVNLIQYLTDSVFIIKKDGLFTLFNARKNTSADLMGATQISMLDNFYGNTLVGVKASNNKWGVINEKGDWLINPSYADLEINETNYIIAAKCDDGINFKYGVIDTENNVLIPFENESITADSNNYEFRCIQGNKLYTKNLMNKILKKEPVSEAINR